MQRIWMLVLLLALMVSMGTSAQEDDDDDKRSLSDLVLVDTVSLDDIAPDDSTTPREAVISPDGTAVALAGREGICIILIDLRTGSCPEYDSTGQPPDAFILHWSPNSRYIAIEQPTLQFLRDGDIIIYDTESNQYLNRTDDNSEANLYRDEDGPEPLVDIAPIWADESGDLYFVRWQPQADDLETLMRIPGPGGGPSIMGVGIGGGADEILTDSEPELVTTLTGTLDRLTLYMIPPHAFDGPMAISPNGDQMALLIRPNDRDSEQRGLWILDLSSGEMSLAVPYADFVGVGVPFGMDDGPMFNLMGAEWTEDGIIVWPFDGARSFDLTTTVYKVDEETFAVTPLIDLSAFDDMNVYLERDSVNGIVKPYYANIMPDESAIIYADNLGNCNDNPVYCGIWALPLEADAEPILLTTFDPQTAAPFNFSLSVGMNENQIRVLLHNTIFTFEYR